MTGCSNLYVDVPRDDHDRHDDDDHDEIEPIVRDAIVTAKMRSYRPTLIFGRGFPIGACRSCLKRLRPPFRCLGCYVLYDCYWLTSLKPFYVSACRSASRGRWPYFRLRWGYFRRRRPRLRCHVF